MKFFLDLGVFGLILVVIGCWFRSMLLFRVFLSLSLRYLL